MIVGRLVDLWRRFGLHARRGLYILSIASLLMPFLMVKSCGPSRRGPEAPDVEVCRGYEMLVREVSTGTLAERVAHGLPILMAGILLSASFRIRPATYNARSAANGARALLAWPVCAIIGFKGLFASAMGDVLLYGWYVHAACWALVYLGSIIGAAVLFVHRQDGDPSEQGLPWAGFSLLVSYARIARVVVVVLPAVYLVTESFTRWPDPTVASLALALPFSIAGLLALLPFARAATAREAWTRRVGAVTLVLMLVLCLAISVYSGSVDSWAEFALSSALALVLVHALRCILPLPGTLGSSLTNEEAGEAFR